MAGAGAKSSKAGRNAIECKAYKSSHRREHNKIKKLKRHLKHFPDDIIASEAVDRTNKVIKGF